MAMSVRLLLLLHLLHPRLRLHSRCRVGVWARGVHVRRWRQTEVIALARGELGPRLIVLLQIQGLGRQSLVGSSRTLAQCLGEQRLLRVGVRDRALMGLVGVVRMSV